MKSKPSDDRVKPVAEMKADKIAFRLVQALATDIESDLPKGLAAQICGRARARDYGYFVDLLPKLAHASATHELGCIPSSFHKVWGAYLPSSEKEVEALYVIGNFLKKYPFSESPVYTDDLRERAAVATFHRNNKWCRRMNRLAVKHHDSPLIVEARKIIASILPKFSWKEVMKRAYFGPGVNVGVSWDQTDTQVKIYLDKTLTPALQRRLDDAIELVPGYLFYEGVRHARGFDFPIAPDSGTWEIPASNRFSWMVALGLSRLKETSTVVLGSKFAVAPKDAGTFRGIAAEPSLNSFLQNGTGRWMRELLAEFSAQLDCSDQERNRLLAMIGAACGIIATIDLTSASDTQFRQLMKNLLKRDWYDAMCLMRSPYIDMKSVGGRRERHKLHMISSQGNGFTFPLETLVFYAITVAAIKLNDSSADVSPNEGGPGANREPSVYGDDIIVCTEDAPAVLKALRDCGFWPNRKKSFYEGPFRESCGHDYRGMNYIRPIFLRRPLEWNFDVISLINHLTSPAGLGWYTLRWSTSFSTLMQCLVDLSKHHPPLPPGPYTGKGHVSTHVQMPMRILRAVKGTASLPSSDPDAKRPTYTEYFYPLRVTPRKFRDIEDVSAYLKGLITPTEGSFSLYNRVKRGEVVVRLPRKDAGQPVLGPVDDSAFESLYLRYTEVLGRIRWFQPSK